MYATFLVFRATAYVCYFFAFAPPRSLVGRWQRAEHSRYMSQIGEREPEARGLFAPDDLFDGTLRSIGPSAVMVALRTAVASNDLVIRAASDPGLVGRHFFPGPGLLGQVWSTSKPAIGTPDRCEVDLAPAFRSTGGLVLVAPIVAGGELWGVVTAVHRRGSLFPEDDLAMLAQLGRNAATALDHAQLVVDRHDRARRAADRRLREVERRVALMFDSVKDYAMVALDTEGHVTAWQPGAEHVFGHRRDQISGEHGATLYEMSRAQFAEWLTEARERGSAEREGTCRRFDGSTFIGTTVIRPLVEEPGEPPAFVAVTHDVTERRELEDRMRQGQKMEAIGQLAGGIAHDFNNLLTAILGYADWLEQDLRDAPHRSQVVEIQKAAERAADLTRQLLTFSRRQTLQQSNLDLTRLIGDLLPMLRRLIGEQVEIVDETSPALSSVIGDRSQLEQVVLNLVVNARDAMPAGGRIVIRTGDVWLGGASASTGLGPGAYVVLQVTDTGIGMDAETKRRVFEPFFTTKEVGRGTGLGLSTVYGIVQQMSGSIQLVSEISQGSTFRLFFPATQPALLPQADPVEADARRGQETLLLVEDDPGGRTYLAGLLETHGYRVLAAEHPRAALRLMESFGGPIDLVISDVLMPGSTGPELVQLLAQKRPGLSALYISGHGDTVLAGAAGGASAGPLLQKPFSSNQLLTKIRQILAAA